MMIGHIDPFNNAEEDWPTYVERLEQYFEVNSLSDSKKVPALISLIGSKTYGLLKNLSAPTKPSSKSYGELVNILTSHLSPKPLVIAERFRFHKRDQKEGERVSVYQAELRKLAEHCNFGEYLNEALRDRFVCGLRAGSIQKRLLAEDKLTLKKATEIATAMETAARDAVELQQQLKPNNAVHVMTKNKSSSCYRCGKKGHTSDNCRFKDATCHSCGKAGHIAPVCRSKPTRTPSNKPQPHQKCKGRVKVMEEVPNMEDDDDDILIARISIHTIGRTACDTSTAVFVTLHLNKTPVKMEVDTGSAITILSMADYKKYLPNEKLLQTKVKLQTYTGETVTPVGLIEVNVSYNKQHYTGKLYIVEGGGPPLLGRDWLAHIKLDWPNLLAISTVQPSTTTEEKLKSLLDEYPDSSVVKSVN